MDDLISRQAAIDFIAAGHLCNPNEPRWSDNEVVNFLKSRPSAQPERCEDCGNFNNARLLIPQPERKKGKWIKADTHNYLFFKNDRVYKCSCCRQLLDFEGVNGGRGDANFCPHCGARMEVEER